jgi:hypothetical protein
MNEHIHYLAALARQSPGAALTVLVGLGFVIAALWSLVGGGS